MTLLQKLNTLKYSIGAGLTTTIITSSQAHAGGFGDVTDTIETNLQNIPSLFSSAAYIMGVGFVIAGLFKLKEYVDDPTSGNMKNALIRLAVGALLILLPFTINTAGDSLGGADADVTFNSVGTL